MKIVITDHRFPSVEQEQRAVAAAGGVLVVGQASEESELMELCRDADAVLTVRAPLTRRVIGEMRRCRVVVRYGIGVDTVDIAAASERGILVANVPDYCIDEVSDHALTQLLMLSRQAIPAMALARREKWTVASMPTVHRLRGQTAGLFGAGRIGSLLAGKLAALGMRVLTCDPFLDDAAARRLGMEKVAFEELLARSDFISIHAPLNKQTRHIFNADTFARMKNSAYLINTARGGLIEENALLAAVNAGQIAGAALDVLESETEVTPVRSALVNHPKVIVTAHTAWLSAEARAALQQSAIEQALACLKGELPYGLVNRELVRPRATSEA